MRSVLLALTLVACTSTEPSGDIFAPVVPPAAQPAAAPVPDAVPEEFRISSEEMQQNAAEARSEQATRLPPRPRPRQLFLPSLGRPSLGRPSTCRLPLRAGRFAC